ncbi:MAG TPA: hypothetical protein PLN30_00460 [Ferruginibacter sp.]|nr:hypothetical protein [Ferruginibacter sp.]
MNDEFIGMAKAAKPHQVIIRNLIINLYNSIDEDFIALPEPNVADGDEHSPQPDVVVYATEEAEPLVCFEITDNLKFPKELRKIKTLFNNYGVKEVFQILYKNKGNFEFEIIKIVKWTGPDTKFEETYSEILDEDISFLTEL